MKKTMKGLLMLSALGMLLGGCANTGAENKTPGGTTDNTTQPTTPTNPTTPGDEGNKGDKTDDKKDQEYRITSTKILRHTGDVYLTFVSFMDSTANKKFKAGETVTGTISFAQYATQSIVDGVYIYVNDEVVKATLNETDMTKANFSFTMPEEDVKIEAIQTNNVLSEEGHEVKEAVVSSNLKLLGYKAGEKYTTFEPVIQRNGGYQVLSLQVKKDGDTDYTTLNTSVEFKDNLSAITDFDVSESDISVKIDEVNVGEYDIVYSGNENIERIQTKVEKATYGDAVTISGFTAKNGFYFAKVADVKGVADYESTESAITFAMPRNNVYINFNINANGTITAKTDANVSSYKVTDSTGKEIANAMPGVKVFVAPTFANELLVLTGATTSNTAVTDIEQTKDNSGAAAISFTMPEDGTSVELEFSYKQGYAVTTKATNGNITIRGNQTAFFAGDKVYFYPRAASQTYELDATSIGIEGHTDIVIAKETTTDDWGSEIETGYYYFTMPSYAVTITATYNEKANITLSYVENDISSFVKSWTISQSFGTGDYSASMTETDHADKKFYTSKALSIQATMSDAFAAKSAMEKRQYSLVLEVTNTDGTTKTIKESNRSGSTIYMNSLTLTATTKSVSFKLVENTAITLTTKDETEGKATLTIKYKASYYDSDTTYDGTQKIYASSSDTTYLSVEASGTPSDGKQFAIAVTNAEGTAMRKSGNGYYIISESVTITVSEVDAPKTCTITINDADSLISSTKIQDSEYNPYYDGSTIVSGTAFNRFQFTSWKDDGFHITVTGVSVKIDQDAEGDAGWWYYYGPSGLTVTDNIVVTITKVTA